MSDTNIKLKLSESRDSVECKISALGLSRLAPSCGVPDGQHLANLAKDVLERHPHFRGRGACLRIHSKDAVLYLDGRLPTWFLKQMAQEIIQKSLQAAEAIPIVNRIVVASPIGELHGTGDFSDTNCNVDSVLRPKAATGSANSKPR